MTASLPLGGRRAYFCHVVKTAGTTLRSWLASLWPDELVFPARTWGELVELAPTQLLEARLVAGHFGGRFPRFFPEPLEIMTIVRDPIEHVLSRHGQMLADPRDALHEFAQRDAATIGALLASERGRALVSNRQSKDLGLDDVAPGLARYWRASQGRPPYADVPQPPDPFPSFEELLGRALGLLDRCAWVGVVERFDESVTLLAHALGVEVPGTLAPTNTGILRVATSDLLDTDRERLEALNGYDRILHAHATRLVDERWRDHVRTARAKWCASELGPRSRAIVDVEELDAIPVLPTLPMDRLELGAFAAAVHSPTPSRVMVVVADSLDPMLEIVVNSAVVDARWQRSGARLLGSADVGPLGEPWVEVIVRRTPEAARGVEERGRVLSVQLEVVPGGG